MVFTMRMLNTRIIINGTSLKKTKMLVKFLKKVNFKAKQKQDLQKFMLLIKNLKQTPQML